MSEASRATAVVPAGFLILALVGSLVVMAAPAAEGVFAIHALDRHASEGLPAWRAAAGVMTYAFAQYHVLLWALDAVLLGLAVAVTRHHASEWDYFACLLLGSVAAGISFFYLSRGGFILLGPTFATEGVIGMALAIPLKERLSFDGDGNLKVFGLLAGLIGVVLFRLVSIYEAWELITHLVALLSGVFAFRFRAGPKLAGLMRFD